MVQEDKFGRGLYDNETDNRWHVEIFESWKNPDNLLVELLDTIE